MPQKPTRFADFERLTGRRACGWAFFLALTAIAALEPAAAWARKSHSARAARQTAIEGALAAAADTSGALGRAAKPQASGKRQDAAKAQAIAKPQEIGLRTNSPAPEVLALGAKAAAADGVTSLSVDLSAPANASAFALADPDRIIVDLPETEFHIPEEAGRLARPEGLIKSFRFGRFAAGKSRIVIDLTGPARIVSAASTRLGAGDPVRLVISLAPETPANFAAAAAQSAAAEAAAKSSHRPPAVQPAGSARPVIVIDPGHGGIDSGAAASAGAATEKAIVFGFAKALALKLEAGKRYKVVLTRDSDYFVALDERVRIARDNHAALFLSIHADTLSDSGDVSGATVYTVAERASDSESARVAEKENGADAAAGIAASEEVSDVSDILFDLTRRETRAYSHVFARQLTGAWANTARLNKNPERAAGFRVLRAPDVPSVLLELGYLSNDRDARFLNSPDWRDRAASGVVKAIDQFFAPRLATDAGEDTTAIDRTATGSIGPSVPATTQPGGN